MKPTARITIELTFEISQLTVEELRQAVEETCTNFIDVNVDFVSVTNQITGEVHGAHLEGYKVLEGPK